MSTTTHRGRALTVVGASVTALALALTGCSSGSSSPKSSGTSTGSVSAGGGGGGGSIKVLSQTGSQQAVLTQLAAKFNAANPSMKVTPEFIDPGSYAPTLLTQLRSGSGPDIFYANGGTGQAYSLTPLAKAGTILDLSSSPWASTLPAAAKPLYQIGGKTYGLPLALVPVGMAVNTGELAKLGLTFPTNVTDLLADCTKAKAAGKYVISVAGAAAPNAGVFVQMIAASTVYAHDPNWNTERAAGKVTFAGSSDWKTALQRIIDLKKGNCLLPGSEGESISGMFNAVGQGQALSLPGPTGVIQAVQAVDKTIKMNLYPFPGTTTADTRAMVGYSDAFAVSAKTKHQATALKFLDFMAQAANARLYANAGGTVSLGDAASGTLPSEASGFTSYVKSGKTAALPNLNWVNGDVYAALTSGVQGLITGQQTPEAVLKAMDTAWDKG